MSWAGSSQYPIGRARAPSIASGAVDAARRARPALLCLAHLRWNFVYQRPQHLMTRFARDHRVLYFEEPLADAALQPWLEVRVEEDVEVLVPRLPQHYDGPVELIQRLLLDRYLATEGIEAPVLWYYTPMSLAFTAHLRAALVVYDCMDELSAFRGAPQGLLDHERRLLDRADLVFTGGRSLYEAKRKLHANVHAFPSSVDLAHFMRARGAPRQPADQAGIPHPRLGFYGVIDERLDVPLVEAAARARPDWQFVLVGPVVKIDPATLPRLPNVHYLGGKTYDELPEYLAGWDAAMLPFARNEATRYISPTKTPEYLAGGCPVVSTPITDVVAGYGDSGVVHIAGTTEDFVTAAQAALQQGRDRERFLERADQVLRGMSWDDSCARMRDLMQSASEARAQRARSSVRRSLAPQRRTGFDFLIVGAGFAGSVLAERLARGLGKRVLVVDRRPHIGGNAYDHYDDAGILVHRYGPHIFHTNAPRIAQYLSRFTQWRPYEHRVLARVDGQLLPMPINLTTLHRLYGVPVDAAAAQAFLAGRAERVPELRTSEDVVVASVGRELYEKFFRGYTRKQWGHDPSELDKSVTARVPTRFDTDDRYFLDDFQHMPLHGYTRMFENMLDHPNIKLMLSADFRELRDEVRYRKLIYSGPIDEFFNYRYGPLPYRSLAFRHETLDAERFQPVAVVNYPDAATPYTRITEYKHLTGQQHARTSISYEYPSAEGDPYYPIPRPENAELYRRYRQLADEQPDVYFVGRLGTYRYYNMDQVVGQALTLYKRIAAEEAPAAEAQADLASAAG